MFQTDSLSMIAMGSDGSEPGFAAGVHLRWQSAAALGFPAYSAELYRRRHKAARFAALDLATVTWTTERKARVAVSGDKTLRSVAIFRKAAHWGPKSARAIVADKRGTLTVSSSGLWREFRITAVCADSPLVIKALDGGRIVASERRDASDDTVEVTIRADRFDAVSIQWSGSIGIYDIAWARLPDDESPDVRWAKLTSLALPADKATALARLSAPPAPTGRDYAGVWKEMQSLVSQLDAPRREHRARSGPSPRPSVAISPFELLTLAALTDVPVARMLGTFYVDAKAEAGTNYDYMIVGKWSKRDADPHRWVCYRLAVGQPPGVPVPSGLGAEQTSSAGGSGGAALAAGLTWSLDFSNVPLASRAPVCFRAFREPRAGLAWGTPEPVRKGTPVWITRRNGEPPPCFVADGPLAPGEYRYRVAGIDLFGRESAPSRPAVVTLVDRVAPPAPMNVRAARDEASGKILVRWEWPVARRQMAPDARQFRIYAQAGGIAPRELHLTDVVDHGDTSACATDLDPAGNWSSFADGFLLSRGQRHRVTAIEVASGRILVTVRNVPATASPTARPRATPVAIPANGYGGRLLFSADARALTGRAVLVVDWSRAERWETSGSDVAVGAGDAYEATLAAFPLSATPSEPVVSAMIGVGAIDASGNVGPVSIPATITARLLVAPPPPPAPWSAMPNDSAYATHADWHGRSRMTIGFETQVSIRYELLRTTDAALVYAAHGRDVKAEDVNDAALVTLAMEHDDAFASVTIAGSGVGPLDGDGSGSRVVEDEFPGRGRARYVYRLRAVDGAGNRSAMSSPLVVRLHDNEPPIAPRITSVLGTTAGVVVRWGPSRAAGIVGYEVYRSDDVARTTDAREMVLCNDDESGPLTRGHRPEVAVYEFTDHELTAGQPFWYAIVAVRASEVGVLTRSALSRAVVGQAYDLRVAAPPMSATTE